ARVAAGPDAGFDGPEDLVQPRSPPPSRPSPERGGKTFGPSCLYRPITAKISRPGDVSRSFHGQRHPGLFALCPERRSGRKSAQNVLAFLFEQTADDERSAWPDQIPKPRGGTDEHGAGQISGDDVGGGQPGGGEVCDLKLDGLNALVERQIFVRRLNGVNVVIDAEGACGAQPNGGDRQDAGAGAHVEHEAVGQVYGLQGMQAQPCGRMMAGAEAHRRLDDEGNCTWRCSAGL